MSTIGFEVKDNIAILTIQHPPANALSTHVFNHLSAALDKVEQHSNLKVVIIRGDDRFFSAGADIKEFTALQNSAAFQSMAEKTQRLFNRMEQFHIPIIAAIHGAALGGGLELAMACHIRFVTETAKLGLPELTLGIIPGFAGTQRLPAYVGTAKAYEMILSGESITGREASSLGLVNQAVPDSELMETTMKLAEKIAAKSLPSIQRIMELISYSKSESFDAGVQAEANAFGTIFASDDAKEGVQAFLEKRKPNFKNN
ncbi:enoyl-CoA hydratase [Virgibacillus sp. W0430]|uniref:enoyl-CoA hydratase n=1 Tax=Virgibacillus sp. W0430 TaxID=3391580 RepID=UPI003F47D70F